ncbi:hypothetical protein K469DRAFT_704939 [Zopfia rhizophila CBS 207.26]|uniref:F-box domain-containing protein n=1 Tax=Zopfia rhizophila CBS 207.26 TaxID=1314779 RepID=A0A6A6EAU9_9PEZI|nr:hypothetical protein K469DRAFT_704939 [Zopfia rhizophila CBS 207.26]
MAAIDISTANLNALPTELLLEITGYLNHCPITIACLAFASRRLHSIFSPNLSVNLKANEFEKYTRLLNILQRDQPSKLTYCEFCFSIHNLSTKPGSIQKILERDLYHGFSDQSIIKLREPLHQLFEPQFPLGHAPKPIKVLLGAHAHLAKLRVQRGLGLKHNIGVCLSRFASSTTRRFAIPGPETPVTFTYTTAAKIVQGYFIFHTKHSIELEGPLESVQKTFDTLHRALEHLPISCCPFGNRLPRGDLTSLVIPNLIPDCVTGEEWQSREYGEYSHTLCGCVEDLELEHVRGYAVEAKIWKLFEGGHDEVHGRKSTAGFKRGDIRDLFENGYVNGWRLVNQHSRI